MMNILLIGCGGREHSIALSLKKSDKCNNLYCYGQYCNPGINELTADYFVESVNSKTNENKVILNICKKKDINMVIIGPEKYLENGLVDYLENNCVNVVGPSKNLALIETSKSYARNLMIKCGLENFTPKFKVFDHSNKVEDYKQYLIEFNDHVIKADGLHGGKGVKISGEHLKNFDESMDYCKEILSKKEKFVIEEKLTGEEFSLMSFTDGITLKHMPPVQDYKRAYENDIGPNTGSMGSVSGCLNFLNDEDINICHSINEKIIEILNNENIGTYKGILYGSFMKTNDDKIMVIEFNARFGDPECINIMSILKTDLIEIFDAIINKKLNQIDIEYYDEISICKYLVPNGYPLQPVKNHEVYWDKTNTENIIVANVNKNGEYNYQLGSRTFAVVCRNKNIKSANEELEKIIKNIHGPLWYRKDIGKKFFNLDLDIDTENNYKKAGVNIEEGNLAIQKIKHLIKDTFNENIISEFGDYAGIYKINESNNLICSTDGVGTKSKFILETLGEEKGYEILGQDIVNHCVNDILVKGGYPLFFLDYYASSKINSDNLHYLIKGMNLSCKKTNCVLIGGETAEMPGIYVEGECDIVGTIVGNVANENIINGKINIKEGDVIYGIKSSGPHTNGYSLIRHVLKDCVNIPSDVLSKLCQPHRCYLDDIKMLKSYNLNIKGLCHITGGGFIDNPPRLLPDNLEMNLDLGEMPLEFKYIQEQGNLDDNEMKRVFNLGWGMLIVIDKNDTKLFDEIIDENYLNDYMKNIGKIIKK